MASVAASHDLIALSSTTESLIVIKSSEEFKKIQLKVPQHSENNEKNKVSNDSDSDCSSVISDFSGTGRYFAVCSGKKLTVWNTSSWSIHTSREIVRAASSIKFTPKENEIVVADKSGDVYLFLLSNEEPGKLILGHLSVILDVLVSTDEKFIITCDRDEKIRVSHFPNAYNIHCFCLGHKEFVSSIKFVPHDESLLISGSGDGSVKCWRYAEGLEVSSYFLHLLPSQVLSESDKSMLAVDSLNILKKDQYSSLICFGIPHVLRIIVLLLQQNEEKLNLEFHSFIDVQSEPVSICTATTHLWILSSEAESLVSLMQWCRKEDKFVSQQDIVNKMFNDIDANIKKIINTNKKQDSIDYLYKKKYDNVQEYLVKKKARIEATL